MARFYFHVKDGDLIICDEEGADLPGVEDARREAEHSARELLYDAVKAGKARVPEAFVIADDSGRTLQVMPFAAVLPGPLRRK